MRLAARAAAATLATLAPAAALAPAALADHAATYSGTYVNAMLSGEAEDGRTVALMAGTHDDFPYHDPGSDYDQIAVRVGGAAALVRTGRPTLRRLEIRRGERRVRFSYEGPRLAFALRLRSVRHTPRYYGDPAALGDLFIGLGYEPGEDAPGLIYTPYELTRLVGGRLELRGERIRLERLHGQLEAGHIDAPTDPSFRSAYEYLAAPSLGADPYTFLGFSTHALHSGPDGSLDSYFRETGSDQFTLEDGGLEDGNPHGAPEPFDNTNPEALPPRARVLDRWAVDLGPGILNRTFFRLRDAAGDPLLALSETIKEDG